jgi:NAD(P)-dependent dehydrogenase (short-subunit alcohol dehydrogenase family)
MKQIILTGSASGFGLLAVKTLAAAGNKVYATMRNVKGANAGPAAELKQWATDSNAQVSIVELDVTSDTSVKAAIAEITQQSNGKIDVLINNAGMSFIGVNESMTVDQTNQLFQVNVIAADRMIKAVLPFMHAHKDGLILNVTSILARNHMPLFSSYNATKAALDALSVGYYYELQTAGIDVAIVQPGGYPTTDIVTKGLKAGNADAEAYYGERMHKLKAASIAYFTPNEDSPNPQEVADVFAKLVALPKGERPLWSIVGAGGLEEAIDHINVSTKTLVDNMLGYMGI